MATNTKKRKRTMKKAMGRAGGLLGRAGRGLMGRASRIEEAVSPTPTRKRTAKKKQTVKKKKRRY